MLTWRECDKEIASGRITKLVSVLAQIGRFQVSAELQLLTENDARSVMELMMQPLF